MKKFTQNFLVIFFTIAFTLTPSVFVEAEDVEESDSRHLSFLFLGVDTGDLDRVDQGRSDTLMVLDINTETNQGVLASIPRDAYVEIEGYGMDKINHAYAFGGSELSLDTVNNFLETEINDYVVVNMGGLKEIIDAVGIIEVTPPTSFSIGGYSFTAGVPVELDSEMALAYARERYTSGGDYARQERQREIVQAIIQKVASAESIMNFIPMFSALSNNIETNLTLPQLFELFQLYNADMSIQEYQLEGAGEMIDGIYYDQINSDSLAELKGLLHN